jgi:beta-glucosidase
MANDVEKLLSELTEKEKCAMVSGTDIWAIPGCDRLGIPGWRVSDGPVGVRGRNSIPGLVLPGPSAMAATWNPALIEAAGRALGQECVDRHVDLLLAPTVNLHRSPRTGRHFEMFSEDPELTARIAVAYIRGVQSEGIGACVKHFIGNEQEYERFTGESEIDERTLRECYLVPFEAAVKEAEVRSVMAAYNYVNGDHACSHQELLLNILKDEWEFHGMVLSDWGAMKETVGPARRGCDVEMPGPGKWWGGGQLEAAVASGEVTDQQLDDKVRRILRFLSWRGRLPGETNLSDERSVDRPEHRTLARKIAAEGVVLLKNTGLLPLPPGSSLALIGPGSASTALMGGGSATVTPLRSTSLLEALGSSWSGTIKHAEGVRLRRGAPSVPKSWIADGVVNAELFDGLECHGQPVEIQQKRGVANWWFGETFPEAVQLLSVRLTLTLVPSESGNYWLSGSGFGRTRLYLDGELITDNDIDGFITGLGMRCGEGEVALESGRRYEVVLEQCADPESVHLVALTDIGVLRIERTREELMAEAAAAASDADIAVVVVGSNDQWETEGADRDTLDLPAGQEELVRRVLAANPRTVLVLNCGAPMLLPFFDDVPAALLAWYPGQEGAQSITDVLTGEVDPGGRMPTTWPKKERDTPSYLHYPGEAGVVRYGEEFHLGYRWYDARGVEPLLPFGHGLSYARFAWGKPTVLKSGAGVEVKVPVKNNSDRAGSEVVQVYLSSKDSPVLRPPKVLVGFAKLWLSPGQEATAVVDVTERAFSRWDVQSHGWVVDPGTYEIVVAASSRDERGRVPYEVIR